MCDSNSELLKAIFERLEITENNLKGEIKELKKFNECLVEKFHKVEKTVIDQQKIILELQQQVNRKNIIIHGIQTVDNEDNLEPNIVNILNNKLNLNLTTDKIEQVYRLGKKGGSKDLPVKVEFVTYKDKMKVIRNRTMLKGTKIFINNDLPLELRIKGMEERKARRERIVTHGSKRYLREQSSEEADREVEKITQEVKKLKERGKYAEELLNMEISQKNL